MMSKNVFKHCVISDKNSPSEKSPNVREIPFWHLLSWNQWSPFRSCSVWLEKACTHTKAQNHHFVIRRVTHKVWENAEWLYINTVSLLRCSILSIDRWDHHHMQSLPCSLVSVSIQPLNIYDPPGKGKVDNRIPLFTFCVIRVT